MLTHYVNVQFVNLFYHLFFMQEAHLHFNFKAESLSSTPKEQR
jgi:hypothetical protein